MSIFFSVAIFCCGVTDAQTNRQKDKQTRPKRTMHFLSLLLQLLANNTTDVRSPFCPPYSTFFGSMGSMLSMALTCVGSAYGTAKASVGISSMGVMKPELVMKAILPVIFAGIVPIYGIIICIMVSGHCKPQQQQKQQQTTPTHLHASVLCVFWPQSGRRTACFPASWTLAQALWWA